MGLGTVSDKPYCTEPGSAGFEFSPVEWLVPAITSV